jgi:hypothetical protein
MGFFSDDFFPSASDEISDNQLFFLLSVYFIVDSLLCCRFCSEGDPICLREIKSGVTLYAFVILRLFMQDLRRCNPAQRGLTRDGLKFTYKLFIDY